MNFTTALIKEMLSNQYNHYTDNYDHYRFGERETTDKAPYTLKSFLKQQLYKRNFRQVRPLDKKLQNKIAFMDKYMGDFEELYRLLADENSRQMLVKLIAYRIMGETKVKLPLSTPAYWQEIHNIEKLCSDSDFIEANLKNWKLKRASLTTLGYPIELYYTPKGIVTTFVLKQYEYPGSVAVQAQEGDTVIDAGGCWGDTALFFSDKVTHTGKVFSFEFIPGNLENLYKNLKLNPDLEKRIKVVEKPVWSESDKPVYYLDNGPGSQVKFEDFQGATGKTTTLSIDDLVERERLEKVDFIKMDIEGAEPYALKGAEKTIRKFKPKLAIALYHSLDDFTQIPKYLKALDLGYQFYLGHFTIHSEETILFAK